jgi:hypothetical protein
MIEIAIALGVIGFALVAIIGILPYGLTVQRDNRAETIINQDATYWIEAIRNGAQGLDDLTNYVTEIVLENDPNNPNNTYTFGDAGIGARQFQFGSNVVSLLTQPFLGTNVTAYVLAISGAAAEKGSEVGFKYQMKVETIPATSLLALNPPPPTLYELRLAFAWPVTQGNKVPGVRPPLVYRTMVSRNVATNYLNDDVVNGTQYYHFTP